MMRKIKEALTAFILRHVLLQTNFRNNLVIFDYKTLNEVFANYKENTITIKYVDMSQCRKPFVSAVNL